jgi:TctA family transporter
LGTQEIAADIKFFDSLTFGFMWATVITGILCVAFNKQIAKITYVPYIYYFPFLVGFIIWACVQYTGGWQDYAILGITTCLGLFMKKYKFSRPALLMAFILAMKIEALSLQMWFIYSVDTLVTRPLFLGIMTVVIMLLVFSIVKRSKLEYA